MGGYFSFVGGRMSGQHDGYPMGKAEIGNGGGESDRVVFTMVVDMCGKMFFLASLLTYRLYSPVFPAGFAPLPISL